MSIKRHPQPRTCPGKGDLRPGGLQTYFLAPQINHAYIFSRKFMHQIEPASVRAEITENLLRMTYLRTDRPTKDIQIKYELPDRLIHLRSPRLSFQALLQSLIRQIGATLQGRQAHLFQDGAVCAWTGRQTTTHEATADGGVQLRTTARRLCDAAAFRLCPVR